MIEFLTGYSTGTPWFDRLADGCVAVIVTTVAAILIWWARNHIHYGSE